MDSAGGGLGDEGPHGVLSPQSLSVLGEGISLVFSRWTALQMAVENAWGGKDSRSNSEELASTILSWFSQSKGDMVVLVDDDSEYESSDEASEMMVDEPMPHEMVVEKPKQKQMPDEDGWSTVTSRRNRGKK
ncbi:hypothetical protein GW17_00000572 [Ensete ventricosum]|nr:hypothetical protein GW17_00000572 [Ensete ventricosum]